MTYRPAHSRGMSGWFEDLQGMVPAIPTADAARYGGYAVLALGVVLILSALRRGR